MGQSLVVFSLKTVQKYKNYFFRLCFMSKFSISRNCLSLLLNIELSSPLITVSDSADCNEIKGFGASKYPQLFYRASFPRSKSSMNVAE
jgi:hypothetical protein